MSVTSLLKSRDVREHLRTLAPAVPSSIDTPILVEPVTRSYALIGTAFDYAARFELERVNRHARTEPWVAEAALSRLPKYSSDSRIMQIAANLVANARSFVGEYLELEAPTAADRQTLAAHSIRLAKLDPTFRAGVVDPRMGEADLDNITDVVKLMEVAPWTLLSDATTVWLNPTFGTYSGLVGGADCDLVSGNRLIDFKVTKNPKIAPDYVLQLVAYAILAKAVKNTMPEWPDVQHLGIYFARHAHLWSFPADAVYDHPRYSEIEQWYFERAHQEFGGRLPRANRTTRNGWPITSGMTPEEIAFLEED